MNRAVLKWSSIVILGTITTLATLYIPTYVPSQEAMANVELGLPLRFVRQDQSFLTPPSFPYSRALTSAHESPPRLRVEMFLISWLFWVAMWWAIARLVEAVLASRRNGEDHVA
jgi:hypothetical protein